MSSAAAGRAATGMPVGVAPGRVCSPLPPLGACTAVAVRARLISCADEMQVTRAVNQDPVAVTRPCCWPSACTTGREEPWIRGTTGTPGYALRTRRNGRHDTVRRITAAATVPWQPSVQYASRHVRSSRELTRGGMASISKAMGAVPLRCRRLCRSNAPRPLCVAASAAPPTATAEEIAGAALHDSVRIGGCHAVARVSACPAHAALRCDGSRCEIARTAQAWD